MGRLRTWIIQYADGVAQEADGTTEDRAAAQATHGARILWVRAKCYATGRPLCGVPRAYRTMADTGSTVTCANPVVTAAGYCRQHDPDTRPKRDRYGRIVKRQAVGPVANDPSVQYPGRCGADDHGLRCVLAPGHDGGHNADAPVAACPNHPYRPAASPSSNLCGSCLMGRA